MPRKQKDPATDVVEYFESAPVESAKTVLAISASIVKRRAGGKAASVLKPAVGKKPKAGPGPAPATVGD